jgi:hypothetical protein
MASMIGLLLLFVISIISDNRLVHLHSTLVFLGVFSSAICVVRGDANTIDVVGCKNDLPQRGHVENCH